MACAVSCYIGKVRLTPLIQRRWHADEDRVDFREPRKIRGRAKMLGLHELLNFVLRNVLDVGLPAVQLFDFCRVGVKPGYAMPGFGKPQSQRQSHVSAPNNSDAELRALEVFRPAIGRHRGLFSAPVEFPLLRIDEPTIATFPSPQYRLAAPLCPVANHEPGVCSAANAKTQGVTLRFW